MTKIGNPKKARIDGQLTALAGELFVAAELLRRGLQTSVTFGNAKAIDLFAHNPRSGISFNVQVKSLAQNELLSDLASKGMSRSCLRVCAPKRAWDACRVFRGSWQGVGFQPSAVWKELFLPEVEISLHPSETAAKLPRQLAGVRRKARRRVDTILF